MSKKKLGLSMERHQAFGRELRQMRNDLVKLEVELGNAYPLVVYRETQRARKAVDLLRSKLEEHMFRQHPCEADTKVYYGAP